jgi:hypothetical protein
MRSRRGSHRHRFAESRLKPECCKRAIKAQLHKGMFIFRHETSLFPVKASLAWQNCRTWISARTAFDKRIWQKI